jgi:hypothetical protein
MKRNQPVGTPFREGDEVVLAEGADQGTLGVFLRLSKNGNWADIAERNGTVRSHPVIWLDHATAATPGYSDPKPVEPQTPAKLAARPSSCTHL